MFAFRLCLALDVKHPNRLLPTLTSLELSEWMAYFSLAPFGQDYQSRVVAEVGAELSNRWRNKGEPPRRSKDFLPFTRRPAQTPEEQHKAFRSLTGR